MVYLCLPNKAFIWEIKCKKITSMKFKFLNISWKWNVVSKEIPNVPFSHL